MMTKLKPAIKTRSKLRCVIRRAGAGECSFTILQVHDGATAGVADIPYRG
jgi:hypothetical protein